MSKIVKTPKAAHQIVESGDINHQMIDRILNADLCIVNLADNNARWEDAYLAWG